MRGITKKITLGKNTKKERTVQRTDLHNQQIQKSVMKYHANGGTGNTVCTKYKHIIIKDIMKKIFSIKNEKKIFSLQNTLSFFPFFLQYLTKKYKLKKTIADVATIINKKEDPENSGRTIFYVHYVEC